MTIRNFHLDPSAISMTGADLSRPECILAAQDGTLWIADDRGGVTRRDPDGSQHLIGNIPGLPNGLALEKGGSLLVAEIDNGILYRLFPDGRSEIVLDSLNGQPLGAVNFVYIDHQDRIWVTVSTRMVPRRPAAANPSFDGYIILIDQRGPRIVADGLCFTNELRMDRAGRTMYVVETALKRVCAFDVADDGSLTNKTAYGPETLDGRPDGIALDSEGNLWVTEVDHNSLLVIAPDQSLHCVFRDPEAATVNFPASLTFGGPDLKTVYIGSLRMKAIPTFRSPISGAPMPHWN